MALTYKVDSPDKFSEKEKEDFIQLLIKQSQVANPTIEKINACPAICVAIADNVIIAIGAIKQVYKTPFDKAELSELKKQFDYELGYLFAEVPKRFQGLGIGKTISKQLLDYIGNENIFATTEDSEDNRMKYILEKLGFVKSGTQYKGGKTGKLIALYLRIKTKEI